METTATGARFRAWHERGDDVAWGALLERLRPRMVLWASTQVSGALRGRVEPDDLVQEILAALHASRGEFRGHHVEQLLGWAFTVARHRAADLAKHFAAAKREERPRPVSGTQTSPSGAAARGERRASLLEATAQALARLSEDDRAIVRLSVLEALPHERVAEALGITVGAARVRKFRALDALRRAFGPDLARLAALLDGDAPEASGRAETPRSVGEAAP